MLHCCQSLSCLPLCVCACVRVCVCGISICRPRIFTAALLVQKHFIQSHSTAGSDQYCHWLIIGASAYWYLNSFSRPLRWYTDRVGPITFPWKQWFCFGFLDDSRGRFKWEVRPKVFQLSLTVVTRSLELRAERETVHSSYLLWSFAHWWLGVISVNMEISFPGSVFA